MNEDTRIKTIKSLVLLAKEAIAFGNDVLIPQEFIGRPEKGFTAWLNMSGEQIVLTILLNGKRDKFYYINSYDGWRNGVKRAINLGFPPNEKFNRFVKYHFPQAKIEKISPRLPVLISSLDPSLQTRVRKFIAQEKELRNMKSKVGKISQTLEDQAKQLNEELKPIIEK